MFQILFLTILKSYRAIKNCVLRFDECWMRLPFLIVLQSIRKSQEPYVEKLKEPVLPGIAEEISRRWGLNFKARDVSSMWFLCKQEASLLNTTDPACAIFSPSEVGLLEWADDLELFILKGYGNSMNYRMGVPLLRDAIQSMEHAARSSFKA